MKTKFDVNEEVLIPGIVKSIAVNDKGEIGYKIKIIDGVGVNELIFDEEFIVPSNKNIKEDKE